MGISSLVAMEKNHLLTEKHFKKKKKTLIQGFIKRCFFINIDQLVERIHCYFWFIYVGLYVLTGGPCMGLMLSQFIPHLVVIEGNAI